MTALEKKLFKSAEGYKGTSNIRKQLEAEARANGLEGDELNEVVNKVLEKLSKTEQPDIGSKFGVAHDPVKQHNNLAALISQMRY
jgi:transcriptional regulator